ncbi:MAG: AraC family transcriptional regulator [Bacteroidota bacterium]|nr:AraC family transcriptional regulator [Bacteroidota bacterium]MDQ6890616.1 AraC family transcriptional regulator [Bacteroidota bacterium]
MNPGELRNPVTYNSSQPDLVKWIREFSKHLKVHPENNFIQYPESFASGFAKVCSIEPGLSYRIVDYTLNTDFAFTREPSDEFYLIIYLYQYSNSPKLKYTVNNQIIFDGIGNNFSTILMTNSLISQRLELVADTMVKGLTIQLTDEWLSEKINQKNTENYSLFKEKNVFKFFLTPKSKKLLNEIFCKSVASATPQLHTNTRVLRILEGFLENILQNGTSENSFPFPEKDFQSILKIENLLLENYTNGFPKIENLSRIALMSETKLKTAFKKAFGMGLYEYYQKNRMHKAKELLTTYKYSVSEVGSIIGYQNLSNFSHAFKKEFGYLPKDCDQIG